MRGGTRSVARNRRAALALFLGLLVLAPPLAIAQQAPPISQLQRNGSAVQLMVDGAPFLVIGGELHNSSASSLAYMEPIWPELTALNLNTVLAVVAWGEVEPREGAFDFSVVDGLIREARSRDLRLVLLWFGSWKNGLSHYAPEWVKRDYRRFPRARLATGTTEVLTPLAQSAASSLPRPLPHSAAQLPPQSMAVSVPLRTPSLQVGT